MNFRIYTITSSMFSTLFSLAIAACSFVGSWFVFKKMGLPGWKGIIPFYNMYVLFDEVWEKKKFWNYVIYSAVFAASAIFFSVFFTLCIVAGFAANRYDVPGDAGALIVFFVLLAFAALFFITMIVMSVLLIVLQFKLYNRLVKCFGKGTGFALGLVFIAPVFMMILGFDKSRYFKYAANQQ